MLGVVAAVIIIDKSSFEILLVPLCTTLSDFRENNFINFSFINNIEIRRLHSKINFLFQNIYISLISLSNLFRYYL